MLDIDISLRRGAFRLETGLRFEESVVGLFGASGSGKTSLLHCIAGLVKPDAGRMVLDNEVLFDAEAGICLPPNKRHIGVVFQDAQLFPHLSVRENLLYGYRRRASQERQFELSTIAELLAIGHLLDRTTHKLSGGEKQRVALGRALLFSPRLLLLDEPLSALDSQLKRQISPFLRRIRDEVGIPMIYVSHALDEILYLTQYLMVVANGSVLGSGHYLDVMGKASSSGVLPDDICNIVPLELVERHADHGFSVARIGLQTLTLPLAPEGCSQRVQVGVRTSQIAIATAAVAGTTIQNQLRGVIRRFVPRSHGILVEIGLEGTELVAEISGKALESLGLTVGDTVYCLIKAQAFEYLDV